MFCHSCGQQLPDGTKFCQYCGAAQDLAQPQAPQQPQYQPQYQYQPQAQPQYSPRPAQQGIYAQKPKENVFLGTVGALLGSLAGVVIMILLMQLDVVAALSGLVMAACSLLLYEKMGGYLSTKGIVICVIVIVVMTFVGNWLATAVIVWQAFDRVGPRLLVCIFRLYRFLPNEEFANAFYTNLALQYLFAALGAVPLIIRAVRTNKARKAQ